MCSRIVVPLGPDRSSTRSQTWCTIHSPWPPRAPGAGWSRPASGSLMLPLSVTSQRNSRAPGQVRRMPLPVGVPDRVGGELPGRQHHVVHAPGRQPGGGGPGADQRADPGQIMVETERLRVRGRRRQRQAELRRQRRVCAVDRARRHRRPVLKLRVAPFRAGQHLAGQLRHVVRAQDRGRRRAERLVDQRLVPGRLPDFGRRAPRPDRLADVADAPARPGGQKRLDPGDDPGRVAAHLGHVREGDLPGRGAECVLQPGQGRPGHRDEARLALAQTLGQERDRRGQVLATGAVEQRDVREAAAAQAAGGCGRVQFAGPRLRPG